MRYSSYLLHIPIQLSMVLIVDGMGYDRSMFFSPPLVPDVHVNSSRGGVGSLSSIRAPCAELDKVGGAIVIGNESGNH
jgi:hypothetical protein